MLIQVDGRLESSRDRLMVAAGHGRMPNPPERRFEEGKRGARGVCAVCERCWLLR